MTPRFPEPTLVLDPVDPIEAAIQWRERGCTLVRGALPRRAVDAARDDMTERLRAQGAVTNGARWSGKPVAHIDAFAFYDGDPEFVRLALSAPVREALEAVVGYRVHVYPSVQIRFALPDDDLHTIPAHQDARYINPDPAFGAYWIPLADIPLTHGGLALVPGSHREGMYDHELSYDYYSFYMGEERPQRCIDYRRVPGAWATADLRAGDVLIFDSFVVHTALPNRSPNIRLSIDGRFQAADRPKVNWQSRHSVVEGTQRRVATLALLPGVDELEPNLREAVVARVLAEDLPIDAATVGRVLAEERARW